MRPIIPKKYFPKEITHINEMAESHPQKLVGRSEADYNNQVDACARRIAEHAGRYKFVMLCGPSASGKTTTAHKIKHRLIKRGVGTNVISMDDFFKGVEFYPRRPDGKPDLESIYALDLDLMDECFSRLLQTGESDFPVYDFTRGKRASMGHKMTLSENGILIVEGIHSLNPMVLSKIPREKLFRIYASVRTKFLDGDEDILIPKDIRLVRRMVRDNKFRGYSPAVTLMNWQEVLEGERKYINPYRDDVDLKLDNTIDYEGCVFHDFLEPIIEQQINSGVDLSVYPELERIFTGLKKFRCIDMDLIPKNSLLREFVGKDDHVGGASVVL